MICRGERGVDGNAIREMVCRVAFMVARVDQIAWANDTVRSTGRDGGRS